MAKAIINNFEDFAAYVGKEIGVSEYLKISQKQISQFADATLDHQWIHLDADRARTESPYKKTIAHGYLTLSLVPYLWGQIVEVNNINMLVNYGIDGLKFNQAVIVDAEVRLRVKLTAITNLRGIAKAELHAVMEIKENPKPAFSASIILLYHFKQ